MSEAALPTFGIDLFIVHPTWDPDAISTALGLEGHYTQRAGDQRRTPTGAALQGRYRDTRWRHCVKFVLREQHFTGHLSRFVDELEPRAEFFAKIRSSGGHAQIILKFLGRNYFGDELPVVTLKALVGLDLDLGLEVFVVPQRSGRGRRAE